MTIFQVLPQYVFIFGGLKRNSSSVSIRIKGEIRWEHGIVVHPGIQVGFVVHGFKLVVPAEQFVFLFRHIHPQKLTWNLEMMVSNINRNLHFQVPCLFWGVYLLIIKFRVQDNMCPPLFIDGKS